MAPAPCHLHDSMVNARIQKPARPDRLELSLPDVEATLALGRALGVILGPGDVVLIEGELGAGKTVLARGMGRGVGVGEEYAIVSPTFTLVNVYPGRLFFFHADLYRLGAYEAAELMLVEDAAGGVLAVEWPERAPSLWPEHSIRLSLSLAGEEARRAVIEGPGETMARLNGELATQNHGETE